MDISQERFDRAKEILIDQAKNKGVISYAGLYDQIGLDHTKPLDRFMGSNILGTISRESLDNEGIMLSSLAFGKVQNEPMEGFYDLALELGQLKERATNDEKTEFWVKQMHCCWEKYDTK
jgi:hypothetical protein